MFVQHTGVEHCKISQKFELFIDFYIKNEIQKKKTKEKCKLLYHIFAQIVDCVRQIETARKTTPIS